MDHIKSISVVQLKDFMCQNDITLLDVREHEEHQYCHLPNAVHIPMNQLTNRYHEIPNGKPLVLYCHHGVRSLQSAIYLKSLGFKNMFNLTGGIEEWSLTVDNSIPRY